MKRSEAMAAMARRAASAALAFALLAAAPAFSADDAHIDYLGYSTDGRYFAFEEYGVQGGSGFPFSSVYLIDLGADRWVSGTPVRVVMEDDDRLEAARETAAAEAEPILGRLDIRVPALALVVNADGDPRGGDGRALAFGRPGYAMGEVVDVRRLALEQVPLPAGIDCEIVDYETWGFRLRLDGVPVYADSGTLPRSRGCAIGYRIYAVLRPVRFDGGAEELVAVIAYYPYVFEGPSRRFLVVPLGAL